MKLLFLGTGTSVVITNGPGSLELNNFTVDAGKTLLLAGQGAGNGALLSTKQMRNQMGTWLGPVILKGAATVGGQGANTYNRGEGRLLISGDISEDGGSYALTKAGDSMLFLRGNNTYSGGTVINSMGGLGGVDAVATSNLGSGPVIFNSGILQFGEAFDLSELTLVSTNNNAVKVDTNGKDVTLAGDITFNSDFCKYGLGTLTLSGATPWSGYLYTSLYGGTLALDYTSEASRKLFNETAIYGTSTLKLIGTGVNFTESSGKLIYLGEGGELTVTNLSDTLGLSIGSFDIRTPAATVDFSTSGGPFSIGQGNTDAGIVGAYATYGKSTWATRDGAGHLVGLAAYGSGWTATDNKDLTLANVGDIPADAHLSTLRFNNTDDDNVPLTLTLTGANVLSSGGILVTANMGSDPATITGGQLTSEKKPANSEAVLIIHQHNTQAPLVISSAICNSAFAVGVTKSGMGTLVISNSASSFTGQIYVNNGQLTVYSPQDLGADAQVKLQNGSVLQMIGTYSVASKISVFSTGGGVDIPTGSSITQTSGMNLGNMHSVFHKTGGGTLTIGGWGGNIGEFSVEGGTLVLPDSIEKLGWAGSMVTLMNNATIKKNAILNHGINGYVLNVVGSGGSVDLDGGSANLRVTDYLNGDGTLTVMNSGGGTPTFYLTYPQTTFTGVLDVELGGTTFQSADMPYATLRLGAGVTWNAINAAVSLGGLAGPGTFDLSNKAVTFNGANDSDFSGVLKGSGTIVKQGSGTWSVSSSDFSQFSGSIGVSNGTFAANSNFTRPITVSGNGMLGGTGSVSQVTMAGGGAVAPAGNHVVGTLTINNNLDLSAGALSVDVEDNGRADCLQVNGDLTLNAASSLTVVDTEQLMRTGSYVVVRYTGNLTGTFGTSNLPVNWVLRYDDQQIRLQGPARGTVIIVR